ncbi:PAS domain S-box-containing protein [Cohnella sp. OV330]|uniref:EAL domain-containing protein n=1 Tax=Cohnella sp. OV330 TaxID=1855288 RepID=UPI0008E67FB3|nr:EAL domain-containing protein [Cohnella sp. OV330]SFA78254.1 PAS domain S-box-containing protein [Cohnella sp. OV330]
MVQERAETPQVKQFVQSAKMMFEHHSEPAWWVDVNGILLGGNEAFHALFGRPPKESNEFHLNRMVAKRDLLRGTRCMLKAKAGRAQPVEAACIGKDGGETAMSITFVPVYADRALVGIYGLATPLVRDSAAGMDAAESAAGRAAALAGAPLVEALSRAIDLDQLRVYYQPHLDIRTGRIVGTEALLRWHHPERGIVAPCDFIPAAEASKLILPIGEWVLRTACAQNKAWQDQGAGPLTIAVNLSPRQFEQENVVDMVGRALADTGLEPRYLELEITEGMTMDVERSIATLKELKRLGVKISVDDFGIGYSSLYYLKRFPIDTLKIDQSFVRDCTEDDNDAMIIKTIIAMAHHLNLNVIAEGVEKPEHLIFLQQNLCDEAQGYLFSRPVPAEALMQNFQHINGVVASLGIKAGLTDQMLMREQARATRRNLETTLRKQQGVTMKFKKEKEQFVHTLCEGELVFRMGFSPEFIVGKTLREFLPPDVADRIEGYYRRAWLGEEHVSYEADIGGIWFLSSLRPMRRGGKVVEVIGSAIDITERKRAEDALRQVYASYRLIAENSTDLISVLDAAGRMQFVSPSHALFLGISLDKLEGNTLSDLIHPEDRQHAIAFFDDMMKQKKPSHGEFRLRHGDGRWLWVETGCTPVLGGDGQVERVISVGRDITPRKQGGSRDES